jgi:intergrase/recombinase
MALANLTKFLGCHREFKLAVEDAGLSWSDGRRSNAIFALLLGKENVAEAFNYARRILKSNVSDDVKRICRFMILSGLRPCEVLTVFRLLSEKREGYLDEERMLLHHWKYREFERRGKRAFLTVLTKNMMEDLKRGLVEKTWSYVKLRKRLKKAKLPVRLYVFRKAWATKMRLGGVEQELVNVFQGRAPRTVFEVSYFRPVLDEAITKVRAVLEQLERELNS